MSHHGFLTSKCGGFTHTATKHITSNIGTHDGILFITHRVVWRVITLVYSDRRCRSDIHCRITNDISGITTTIHITDGAKFISASQLCFGVTTRNHVDVHRRAAIDRTVYSITTTIDLTDTCCRDNVEYWWVTRCKITYVCIFSTIRLHRHVWICSRCSWQVERLGFFFIHEQRIVVLICCLIIAID